MLTDFQRRKAERHFEALDTDRSGVLTFDDLHLAAEAMLRLERLTPERSEQRLQQFDEGLGTWWQALTVFDRNGDGEITPEEFLHGYERVFLTDDPSYRQAALAGARARFDLGDTDRDGVMDEEEFTDLFHVCFDMPRPTAAWVFSRFLPEGERGLTREVYERCAMEFLTGDDPQAVGTALLGPWPSENLNT